MEHADKQPNQQAQHVLVVRQILANKRLSGSTLCPYGHMLRPIAFGKH